MIESRKALKHSRKRIFMIQGLSTSPIGYHKFNPNKAPNIDFYTQINILDAP